MDTTPLDCWVYLDEVGNFHHSAASASAIGGWFSFIKPSEEECIEVLRAALDSSWPTTFHYHAVNFKRQVQSHVRRALPVMRQLGWRPLIFLLQQGIHLKRPLHTYMHALADGLVSFGRRVSRSQKRAVKLTVTAALWSSAENREYSRINERLELERLRRNKTASDLPVEIDLQLGDARSNHKLMIADLMMYALSHLNDYQPALREALQYALGPYHFDVLGREDHERVRDLFESNDHGAALLEILAALGTSDADGQSLINLAIEGLEPVYRDPYILQSSFSTVGKRIEIEVAQRRLDTAERQLVQWRALLSKLGETGKCDSYCLEVAQVEALDLLLRLNNHRGAVGNAAKALRELDGACQAIAGHLEALPLLLNVRCNMAVHRTNCFHFDVWQELLDLADAIEILHQDMDRLLGPGNQGVRSAMKGRVLGTALQACTKAAWHDPNLYPVARELSDSALRQFNLAVDIRRQAAYRCELETDAGNIEVACDWLRVAAGFEPTVALSEVVATIADEDAQGFNYFHLVRLWARCEGLNDRTVANTIATAYGSSVPRQELFDASTHPWPAAAWKLGRALGLRSAESSSPAHELLESAIRRLEANGANVTLRAIALAVRCDLVALCCATASASVEVEARALEKALLALAPLCERVMAPWLVSWIYRTALAARAPDADTMRLLADEIPY